MMNRAQFQPPWPFPAKPLPVMEESSSLPPMPPYLDNFAPLRARQVRLVESSSRFSSLTEIVYGSYHPARNSKQ